MFPALLADVSLEAGKMSTLDVVLFLVAVVGVIAFGIWQGRRESAGEAEKGGAAGYFLAGRGLTWWLVGFSLIAANISTEQFVGMSGQAADWLGLAVSSWEWLSVIALVMVAFVFLPKLLRCGIYTIPEFLQYRYGTFSRIVMAIATLIILVGVPTASVIYSGAKVISVFFQGREVLGADLGSITVGCWIIGVSAAVYVLVGGLKACAWTDLIWGAGLIAGGAVVMWLAFGALKSADPNELILTKVANSTATVEDLQNAGAWERFMLLNDGKDGEAAAVAGENLAGGKLHMIRPIADPELPWTVLLLGIWVPICFYWGLNQYIVQRTLASKSLAEGQKGILFAAVLKLVIPFLVVIPGILCFNLYHKDLRAEAVKKNAGTMAEVSARANKVYPFTENFALNSPEQAREVLIHNSGVAGVAFEALPADASAKQLVETNANMIAAAAKNQVLPGTKLVGYDYDAAFPTLMRNLMRPGLTWFVLAAIFGAVVSSLASMLNSAATIATMDLVHKAKPDLSEAMTIRAGRFFTLLFVLISCLIAPGLGDPKFGGIFKFIQEFQGFISPGVLGVFLFGFLSPRTPRYFGWLGIVTNAVLYAALKKAGPHIGAAGMWWAPDISYVDRMGLCFLAVVALGFIVTRVHPLPQPVKLPVTDLIQLESSKTAKVWGALVIVATLLLYVVFA